MMNKSLIGLTVAAFAISNLSWAESTTEFYSDIMPIVENRCLTCHSEAGVSFSFEDPDITYSFRAAMSAAVASDRMPPWLAEPGHKAYVNDYSLTAEEKAKFETWAKAGHPRDPEPQPSQSAAIAARSATFEADLSVILSDGRSYLPEQNVKDDYRCFIVDWPYSHNKYVTGFKAEPGNLKIAHHLVNFVIPPESVEMIREFDAGEDGDGYSCLGSPLPDRMADDKMRADFDQRHPGGWDQLLNDQFWLSQWAPGTYDFEFPQNTGVLIEPGSVVVVQMHYYSPFAPGESDQNTTMHFQLADIVEKPSVIYPLHNRIWLTSRDNNSMTVPARGESTYETSENFEAIAEHAGRALLVDTLDIEAIELQSANVHMHAFGASGSASLIDVNGKKQTLLNIPRWDLNWQRDFTFQKPIRIEQKDMVNTRLVVECTYANHTDELVYGGVGSYDEMCFNFSYVSLVLKDSRQVVKR